MPRSRRSSAPDATPWRRAFTVALVVGLVCGLVGYAAAHLLGSRAATREPADPDDAASPSATTSRPADPVRAKALAAYDRLTPEQRVGQLFMIGVTSTGPTQEQQDKLREGSGGNVFLRGHSDLGVDATADITRGLRDLTSHGGVAPFISADQEGGQAQQLTGDGFDTMPSAVVQAVPPPSGLRRDAVAWAEQLKSAGVTLNLAPVGDVVPDDVGSSNQPIGRYDRQYGSDTTVVGNHAAAFVQGMADAGLDTTLKHFPGLGRATGNTDDDPDATDPTTRDDPLLAAYRPAVAADVPFVMVSSARYPAIDDRDRACFSTTVIGDMLRRGLGFDGVVISDSFGSASLASTPPGVRAVRFLEAGGTMVLDTSWLDLAPMTARVLDEASKDRSFAATVRDAVLLVLEAKVRAGLVAKA